MKLHLRSGACVALLALLHGCGSSGGGPAPVDQPPTFTSAANVSFQEQSNATVYQATASDPEGKPVTFSITGGADAALFSLTADGKLTFKALPDFEAPTDANTDNIYQIQIAASDGGNQATLTLSVQVMNIFESTTPKLIASYVSPVAIAPARGTRTVLVAEQNGRIYAYNPAGAGTNQLYLTIPGLSFAAEVERGVINIVSAPDYAQSGILYALIATADELQLRRYRRTTDGVGDLASEEMVMRFAIPGPVPRINATSDPDGPGGALEFGPDGLLYIGTGTAGHRLPNAAAAQSLQSLRGKLLRIDVSRDDFPGDPDRNYGIPAGNPYAGSGTTAPEIMAIGLRHPQSMAFTDLGLIVGMSTRPNNLPRCCSPQAILFRPQDAGTNYGFGAPAGTTFTPPIISVAILANIGGYMQIAGAYRGSDPSLTGRLLFADPAFGSAFSVPLSRIAQGTTLTQIENRIPPIVGFTAEGRLELNPSPIGNRGSFRDFAMMDDGDFYMLQREFDVVEYTSRGILLYALTQ